MKLKWILLFGIFSSVLAQNIDVIVSDPELFDEDNQDQRLIRPLLREVRAKPLLEKPDIRISGDVRVRYRYRDERIAGRQITVGCGQFPFPGNDFSDDRYRLEANLLVDYAADCTWASIKLEFENEMGKISGTERGVDLERCLIGYMLFDDGETQWYAEVGRQRLDEKFESELMFGSRMDGIYSYYGTKWRSIGDFYAQGAAMVMDYRCNLYAYVGEFGWTDLWCTGLYFKYAFIDWPSHVVPGRFVVSFVNSELGDVTNTLIRVPAYRISQWVVGYNKKKFVCGRDLKLRAGFLWNHAAEGRIVTFGKKENIGWYVFGQLGSVRKCGDWSFRAEWDYCEAQSILESDNNGIGRGNANRSSLFQGIGPSTLITANARGDTNYYGPSLLAAYGVTDDLVLRWSFIYSHSIDDNIGGEAIFYQTEVQAIYAF